MKRNILRWFGHIEKMNDDIIMKQVGEQIEWNGKMDNIMIQ